MPHEWEGQWLGSARVLSHPLPPAKAPAPALPSAFPLLPTSTAAMGKEERDNAGGSDLKNPQLSRLARTTNHLEGIITY